MNNRKQVLKYVFLRSVLPALIGGVCGWAFMELVERIRNMHLKTAIGIAVILGVCIWGILSVRKAGKMLKTLRKDMAELREMYKALDEEEMRLKENSAKP